MSDCQTAKRNRFFISCVGSETKLQRGDTLTLLGDSAPSGLLFLRDGGYGMAVRSDGGELPITGAGKVFSREDARLLAIGLAVGAGFSLEEEETDNPIFRSKNVSFTFV